MDGLEIDSNSRFLKPLPTAFITAGVVVLLFIWWQEACNCALRKKINAPSPKGWPIIGNMLDARKLNGVHLLLCNYIKNHGKVFSFSMFGKPSLVIADPDMLKKILVKHFWNFRNRFMVIKLKGTIIKSVFFWTRWSLEAHPRHAYPVVQRKENERDGFPDRRFVWEIDAKIRRRCQYR